LNLFLSLRVIDKSISVKILITRSTGRSVWQLV
jgi:hypothetical protein